MKCTYVRDIGKHKENTFNVAPFVKERNILNKLPFSCGSMSSSASGSNDRNSLTLCLGYNGIAVSFTNQHSGAKEMAQWLRASTSLL